METHKQWNIMYKYDIEIYLGYLKDRLKEFI